MLQVQPNKSKKKKKERKRKRKKELRDEQKQWKKKRKTTESGDVMYQVMAFSFQGRGGDTWGGDTWRDASLQEQGVAAYSKGFGRVVGGAAGFVVNGYVPKCLRHGGIWPRRCSWKQVLQKEVE